MAKNKKIKLKSVHLLVFAVILLIVSLLTASKGGLSKIVNLDKQSLNRIKISGVMVANFINESSSGESPSYYSIAKTADYHIFFMQADELFFISITSYPFDEHRGVAEQKLLEVLAISEDDACKLNVDITTPAYANPDRAGEVYNLSFCK